MNHFNSTTGFGGRSDLELNIIENSIAEIEQFLSIHGEDFWYDDAIEAAAEAMSRKGIQMSKEELGSYLLYRNKSPRERRWADALDAYHQVLMDIIDAVDDEHDRCKRAYKAAELLGDEETMFMLKAKLAECDKIGNTILNIYEAQFGEE